MKYERRHAVCYPYKTLQMHCVLHVRVLSSVADKNPFHGINNTKAEAFYGRY